MDGVEARPGRETRSGSSLVAALVRWAEAGAVWRVVDRREDQVSVALLRCDGGEEVERMTSRDPDWLAYLARTSSSEHE